MTREDRDLKALYEKAWRYAPAVGRMRFRRLMRVKQEGRYWKRVRLHYEALSAAIKAGI